MKCVVLAAGRGSRLARRGRPKPLVPVLGLPLLERTIATAAAAGLADFCVVTGYAAGVVDDLLAVIAARRRVNVTIVRNDNWAAGNGASLLAARAFLDEYFVLLVGDHVFDPDLLAGLVRERPKRDSVIVAADFRLDRPTMIDPDDATKLLIQKQRVVEIGKQLSNYNAYDAGLFTCRPAVFSALQASARDGDDSLTGGFRRLARCGAVRAFDVGDHAWVDVDAPQSLRTAERVLRQGLSKPEDGAIARTINRRLSTRVVTPLLLRYFPTITPNQVSILGLLVAIAAAGSFLAAAPVAGGLLVALASILDGSDGETARLKYMQTSFGAYLDATLDRYADSIIIAAMGIYAVRTTSDTASGSGLWTGVAVAASLLALIGSQMRSYTSVRSIVDLGYRYRARWIAAGRGRDVRLFTLSLGAVATAIHAADPTAVIAALAIVGLVANGVVGARLWKSWHNS